jgi:hypothetical protein
LEEIALSADPIVGPVVVHMPEAVEPRMHLVVVVHYSHQALENSILDWEVGTGLVEAVRMTEEEDTVQVEAGGTEEDDTVQVGVGYSIAGVVEARRNRLGCSNRSSIMY